MGNVICVFAKSPHKNVAEDIVRKYFESEHIDLNGKKKAGYDLCDSVGTIRVEVKSFVGNDWWRLGRIPDSQYQCANDSLNGLFRYEIHIIQFEDERKEKWNHYVLPASEVSKFYKQQEIWWSADVDSENIRHIHTYKRSQGWLDSIESTTSLNTFLDE